MGQPPPKTGQVLGNMTYTANGWVTNLGQNTPSPKVGAGTVVSTSVDTLNTMLNQPSLIQQMAAIANSYTNTTDCPDSAAVISFFNNPSKVAAINSTINLYGGLPKTQDWRQTGSNGLFGSHKLYSGNYNVGTNSMHVYFCTAQLFDRFPDKGKTTDACSSIQSYLTGLGSAQVAADTQYAADHNDSNHSAMTTAISNVLNYYQGLNGSLSCSTFLQKQKDDAAAAAAAAAAKQTAALEIETAKAAEQINQNEVAKSPTMYALYGLGIIAVIVVSLVTVKVLKD